MVPLLMTEIQPVSYKRYFRCNNCFLLLVYTIHLSLSTNLVDPPPMRTIYMKHSLPYNISPKLIEVIKVNMDLSLLHVM